MYLDRKMMTEEVFIIGLKYLGAAAGDGRVSPLTLVCMHVCILVCMYVFLYVCGIWVLQLTMVEFRP